MASRSVHGEMQIAAREALSRVSQRDEGCDRETAASRVSAEHVQLCPGQNEKGQANATAPRANVPH